MKPTVFDALAAAARSRESVALGVITGVKGSSPQRVGAKALFHADGRIDGTLGGGCLEAEIQKRAIESLDSGKAATFELLLDHDFGWDDGLICGGKVLGLILPNAQSVGEQFWKDLASRTRTHRWGVTEDFTPVALSSATEVNSARSIASKLPATASLRYQESVPPPCALWVAGAGHIAQAVAPLAHQLDFDVTVFDDRPALVNSRFFPEGIHLRADAWERLLELPPPATPCFALIVTRGHRHDALVLKSWIKLPFSFLGMIGSSRKSRIIFDHFARDQIATPEELRRVVCPVGLSIGAKSVPEIAVSILAQFIEKRAETLKLVPSSI